MPVKNESAYIRRALDSVVSQTYSKSRIDILLVDGGSTDNTCAVIREYAERDDRIRLLDGEDLNCPMAMNVGIQRCRGEFVAKVDGHGYLEKSFIELAIHTLESDSSIACVGGKVVACSPRSSIQRANAHARFSWFAVGSGVYTAPDCFHSVDSVQCGVYRKSDVTTVGLFDPSLQFGEDEELNWRLVREGKRIILHPQLRFHYEVRPTFLAIFRQYMDYGRARIRVIGKHRDFLKLKHCVPASLVMALGLSLIASLMFIESPNVVALPWVVYAAFLMAAGVSIGIRKRYLNIPLLWLSLISIHIGYGLGSLYGLTEAVARKASSSLGYRLNPTP